MQLVFHLILGCKTFEFCHSFCMDHGFWTDVSLAALHAESADTLHKLNMCKHMP